MGLTNKQFDTIMQHYDDIQKENRDLLAAKEQEIRKKIPQYFQFGQEINSLRVKRAKASLSKNEAFVSQCLKEEQDLIEKRDKLLLSEGYPADYLSMTYHCPICKDKGLLSDNRTKCTCFISAQTKLLFEQSGIYELIKTQNFDTLSYEYFDKEHVAGYQNAVTIAKNFITNFNSDYQNLLFYGNVGTGKTFLTCCIAKELMEQGISVTYCSAEQLFRMLVDLRFQEDKDSYFSFMEDIHARDVLIIDDLGTETVTERVRSDLFTCLNNRDMAHKSTIISTNLSIEELNKRYSERIFSRMSSHFTFCKFDGPDIRMKIKLSGN